MQKRKTIEKMPRKSLLAILLIILGHAGQAASPDWTATPNLQFNMNVTSKLQIDEGTFSLNENDLVAGFVNGECRGVASPMAMHNGLIFLTIGSNQSTGEMISFKAYLADEDKVVELDQTLVFEDGVMTGTAGDPYLFTFDPVQLLLFSWTGSHSTEWMYSGNWNFYRAPHESEDVIVIPSGKPRYPVLDVMQTAGDLTIAPGASLIIAPDGRLTVTSTLENETGAGGLVIRSDATGTGSLLHHHEGVQATVERFVSGGEYAWHQLSSPVAAQDMEDAFVDGSMYAWHEPAQGWVNFHNNSVWPAWADVNEGHTYFIPARGYLVAYPYQDGSHQTKMFSGALNQGAMSFALVRQAHPGDTYAGFNMTGNPYPSSIDWKAQQGWTNREGGLEEDGGGYNFWVWNDVYGNYGVYHSASTQDHGTLDVSRHISPMQAFWVRASGEPADLGFDDRVRTHSDQPWLKAPGSRPGILRLAVSSDANPWQDEMILEFGHPGGQGGAKKMFSLYPEAPSLYSLVETTPYSISFHEQATEHTIVPIGFRPGAEGLFAISAEGADHFEQIYLVDKQLGFYHDLHTPGSYAFAAEPHDDPMRFELRFSAAGPTAIHEPSASSNIWFYGNTLYVNSLSDDLRLTLLELSGRHLRSFRPGWGEHAYPLDLPPGIFLVSIGERQYTRYLKLIVP